MAGPPSPRRSTGFDRPPEKLPTQAQSAGYTYDMLLSLGRIAALHQQAKLALLLEIAADEARVLAVATDET